MKSTKFFGWLTLILFLLVVIAGNSDYWEDWFPFGEGSFVWSAVFFFSTVGVVLLMLSLLILIILQLVEQKRRKSITQ